MRQKLTNHLALPANEFGSQIRSYTLQPYCLVKDARSGLEVSGSKNVSHVLDGAIDEYAVPMPVCIGYRADGCV